MTSGRAGARRIALHRASQGLLIAATGILLVGDTPADVPEAVALGRTRAQKLRKVGDTMAVTGLEEDLRLCFMLSVGPDRFHCAIWRRP